MICSEAIRKPPPLPTSRSKKLKQSASGRNQLGLSCFQSHSLRTSEKDRLANALSMHEQADSNHRHNSSLLHTKYRDRMNKMSQAYCSTNAPQTSMEISNRNNQVSPGQFVEPKGGDYSYSQTPGTKKGADSSIRSLQLGTAEEASTVFSYFKRKLCEASSSGDKSSQIYLREELDLKDSDEKSSRLAEPNLSMKLNLADPNFVGTKVSSKSNESEGRTPADLFSDIMITRDDRRAVEKIRDKFEKHLRQKTAVGEQFKPDLRRDRKLGTSFDEKYENVVLTRSDLKEASKKKPLDLQSSKKDSRMIKQIKKLTLNIRNRECMPKVTPFQHLHDSQGHGEMKERGKDLLQHIKLVKKNILEGLKRHQDSLDQTNKENEAAGNGEVLFRPTRVPRDMRAANPPAEQKKQEVTERKKSIERSIGSIRKSLERMKSSMDRVSMDRSELHQKKALLALPIARLNNQPSSREKRTHQSNINTKRTTIDSLSDYLNRVSPFNPNPNLLHYSYI